MKHSFAATIETIGWMLAAVALTLALIPLLELPTGGEGMGWIAAAIFVASIAITTAVLIVVFRKWKKLSAGWRFAVIAAATFYLFAALANTYRQVFEAFGKTSNAWIAGSLLAIAFMIAMLKIGRFARSEGKEQMRPSLRVSLVVSNIAMITLFAYVAAVFTHAFTPLIAVALLVLLAIYDAIMVWRTGHMIELAQGLVKTGFIPGIVIATKAKKGKKMVDSIGLLGGGDVLFLALIGPCIMWSGYWLAGVSVLIGMFAALTTLLLIASKDRFYPAMPTLLLGAVLGYIGYIIGAFLL